MHLERKKIRGKDQIVKARLTEPAEIQSFLTNLRGRYLRNERSEMVGWSLMTLVSVFLAQFITLFITSFLHDRPGSRVLIIQLIVAMVVFLGVRSLLFSIARGLLRLTRKISSRKSRSPKYSGEYTFGETDVAFRIAEGNTRWSIPFPQIDAITLDASKGEIMIKLHGGNRVELLGYDELRCAALRAIGVAPTVFRFDHDSPPILDKISWWRRRFVIHDSPEIVLDYFLVELRATVDGQLLKSYHVPTVSETQHLEVAIPLEPFSKVLS